MGTFTISSWCYYNESTIIATGDKFWSKQAESAASFNSGSLPASYTETTGVNDSLDPNEILDPDYSASNATYLGTVTFNGNTFVVFEDEFGQLLGSSQAGLSYSDFPVEVDYPDGTVSADPNDGVAANSTPFCFLSGTRIATPAGEVAVEDLQIGDSITVLGGQSVRVKWIGRQLVSTLRHGPHMQPVRIRKGALGDGLPHSDLTVTADHGMIIDGLVVNAGALVNGDTINWVLTAELADGFTVYHIETENHDVILANGAPAETFIDYAGRKAFDNYREYVDLYGGVEPLIPEMPMLRVSSRRQLPAHLCDRFGIGDYAEDVTADALAYLAQRRVA